MKSIRIGGRMCHIETHSPAENEESDRSGIVLYAALEEDSEGKARFLAEGLKKEKTPFVLAAFESDDWNRDYSPWAAPAVFGAEDFSGGGEAMLQWMEESLFPVTEGESGAVRRMLAGYSLAGLFSLWAFYKTGWFAGAASCSGSLWFPGWSEFAEKARGARGSVYLSLGQKEERTRNAVMASVGDRTREQFARLVEDPGIVKRELTWHPGGHFHEPDERLLAGLRWLLTNG